MMLTFGINLKLKMVYLLMKECITRQFAGKSLVNQEEITLNHLKIIALAKHMQCIWKLKLKL